MSFVNLRYGLAACCAIGFAAVLDCLQLWFGNFHIECLLLLFLFLLVCFLCYTFRFWECFFWEPPLATILGVGRHIFSLHEARGRWFFCWRKIIAGAANFGELCWDSIWQLCLRGMVGYSAVLIQKRVGNCCNKKWNLGISYFLIWNPIQNTWKDYWLTIVITKILLENIFRTQVEISASHCCNSSVGVDGSAEWTNRGNGVSFADDWSLRGYAHWYSHLCIRVFPAYVGHLVLCFLCGPVRLAGSR